MSKQSQHEIECPECGKAQIVSVWDSVNVTLDPSLRDRLFKGEINQFKCDDCDFMSFINMDFLYHDMERKFAVQYYPEGLLENPENFYSYKSDGRIDSKKEGLPGDFTQLRYLTEQHVVFSMYEMLNYIRFRELLFLKE